MAAERKIRWFFKLIQRFNIELGKLRLPLKFVRSLNNEIPDTATLHTPDKRVWNMKVVQDGSHIWLEDRFGEFARHYSLQQGHQVHFQHKSESNFSVRIFDKSCCEIAYPSQAKAPPNTTAKKPKTPTNTTAKKPKTPQKNPEHTKFTSDSGFLSPRHFKSKRPFFEVELKSYNTHRNIVYVPELFRKRYMAKTQAEGVKLKVSDGRNWKVNLKRKRTGRLSFGMGWKQFSKENKLKKGDVCIFELAKGKDDVFKVFIFVAV